MPEVITVRLYRRDLTGTDTELIGRLQALAELELARIRENHHAQTPPALQTLLADGFHRVTAGTVDEQDLPLAAAALQRGDDLTVELVTADTDTIASN
jgi:hypothetical protein